MANPTTNFGWVMPNSADLVTDLPADFAVFGQGVDTSMQYLLGGTTGQILSKTSGTNMAFTWINNDQGDITGVTAGTGITGGGTSGTVTVTNDMATTITTAGDLIKGTGSGTYNRLGIGSTSQVLTVVAGAPAWATPAGSTPTVNWVTLTSGTSWSVPAGIKSATIYAIAGGGGGCGARGDGNKYPGGGGGAGGLALGTFDLSSVAGSTISYAIGAGGAGGAASTTSAQNNGTNGSNTTFGTALQAWYLSATGGGGGAGNSVSAGLTGGCGGGFGGSGGSALLSAGGGGGLGSPGVNANPYDATAGRGGLATQGNNGGAGGYAVASTPGSGGGGIFINNRGVGGGGHGGAMQGQAYMIDNVTFGGGTCGNNTTAGGAATANTGGGGGGGGNNTANNNGTAGGNGGSGVIYIQYLS